MGQLGLHEPYANQFLPTSRLILNSILCRGSCGSYYAHAQCGLSAPLKFAPLGSASLPTRIHHRRGNR
jgi:hypothetical protein